MVGIIYNRKVLIFLLLLLFVESDDDCVPDDSGEKESQKDEETNPPENSFPLFDSEVAEDDDAEEEADHRAAKVSGVTNLKSKFKFKVKNIYSININSCFLLLLAQNDVSSNVFFIEVSTYVVFLL